MTLGPDFIGIGAQRSGTSWLYAALRRHPALWLPPLKELHYFDDPMRNKRYYYHLRLRLISGLWIRHPLSPWDLRYFLTKRSDDWYGRLFEPGRRRGLLTGEITPKYSVLDEGTFARMRAINPRVKLIFIMRDPIMRSWSGIMNRRKKQGIVGIPSRETALRTARRPGVQRRSSYLDNIERLERVFQRDQIFYGFFDDLVENPKTFITNMLKFLGVDPGNVTRLLPSAPVGAVAAGRRPPPEFERELAASFLPGVRKLCERFEGPPHIWRARYEALLDGRAGSDRYGDQPGVRVKAK